MTAQITDEYTFNDELYTIIAISDPIDFRPEEHGFQPSAASTACWRGYWCEYRITEEEIYLDKFHVHQDGAMRYPVFCGQKAHKSRYKYENMLVYSDLHFVIHFTGSIVLGRGSISKYCVNMGFQRAWAYEKVIELRFENGAVVETVDHSDYVRQIRREIELDPTGFDGKLHADTTEFVKNSFSLAPSVKAWWI